MKYEYAVYIGRFQPFHKAHHQLVRKGLEQADNVIIVIGSANKAQDSKNPFSAQQRKVMITAALSIEEQQRVSFIFADDSSIVCRGN